MSAALGEQRILRRPPPLLRGLLGPHGAEEQLQAHGEVELLLFELEAEDEEEVPNDQGSEQLGPRSLRRKPHLLHLRARDDVPDGRERDRAALQRRAGLLDKHDEAAQVFVEAELRCGGLGVK